MNLAKCTLGIHRSKLFLHFLGQDSDDSLPNLMNRPYKLAIKINFVYLSKMMKRINLWWEREMKRDERRVFDCVMEHETVWDKLDKKKIEEDRRAEVWKILEQEAKREEKRISNRRGFGVSVSVCIYVRTQPLFVLVKTAASALCCCKLFIQFVARSFSQNYSSFLQKQIFIFQNMPLRSLIFPVSISLS